MDTASFLVLTKANSALREVMVPYLFAHGYWLLEMVGTAALVLVYVGGWTLLGEWLNGMARQGV
jgi:hypothetical protein